MVVDEPRWVRTGSWVVSPILGAALGLGLAALADLAASLPFLPFGAVVDWYASLPDWPSRLIGIAVGLVAGLAFAGVWAYERLVVDVTPERVVLRQRGDSVEIARGDVGAVFLVGTRLSLLRADSSELAHHETDLGADVLRAAFEQVGYPWRDADPHADDFALWVPGTPTPSAEVSALLMARAEAVTKGKDSDARAMRAELGRHGVVVRDDKKRQHWRAVRP